LSDSARYKSHLGSPEVELTLSPLPTTINPGMA
jgi:hypothetical protein